MPTRTAFVITIGDVIESRPPRRKRQAVIDHINLLDSSNPPSPDSSSSEGSSDQDARPLFSAGRHRGIANMKTRTLTTSVSVSGSVPSTNGSTLTNGCNGLRKGRLLSADQVYGSNGPLSPRTRSGIKQEIDDEVSFVEPVMDDDDMDEKGTNGGSHGNDSHGLKKKRRSVNEKFLEDNSEYYGFQVLTSKLRSSGEAPCCSSSSSSSASNSFQNSSSVWEFLHDDKDGERRNRQRHKSASHADGVETTTSINGNGNDQQSTVYSTKLMLRRARTASSSSGTHLCSDGKKHLRVAVEKIKVESGKRQTTATSSDDDNDDEDDEMVPRKSTRKSSLASLALSPSSRKRRSELDKLLEAGSSSFHFETARETATRLNGNELGPIHVDVDDNSSDGIKPKPEEKDPIAASESEIDDEVVVEPSAKKKKKNGVAAGKKSKAIVSRVQDRLLQQADSVSSSTAAPVPKKRGNPEWLHNKKAKSSPGRKSMGRPPKSVGRRKGFAAGKSEAAEIVPDADEERRLLLEKYLPADLFEEIEQRLEEVDGSEADVEAMEFSFERTPFRESWFTTYSRQDQGEEILYYPEPKSFPLPYEMPISTFYPKKDGPGGRGDKRGLKRKLLDTEASSTMESLAPSGTATPTEFDPESSIAVPEDDPWARAPPPPPLPKPLTRGKRGRPADALVLANALKRTRALGAFDNNDLLSKLGPKAAQALREFSRKSPRGHASTRSLISAGETNEMTDSADDGEALVDVESVDSPNKSAAITPAHLIDECSNDSTASRFSHFSSSDLNPNPSAIIELEPSALDEFLREQDPDLAAGDISTCTSPVPAVGNDSSDGRPVSREKKMKRRSSDRRHHHHKHHRRSKDPNSSVPMDDPMDRLVALNVDEVLLDCLEDELPSVTFDGELPGSEPLELVDNYNLCDAMLLCTSRKTRPRPFLRTPSTSSGCSTLDAKDKSGFDEPVSPRRTAVLNRLMSSSSPKRKSKTSSSSQQPDNSVEDENVTKEEDSSSEYTSACETLSVASSAPNDRRSKKTKKERKPKISTSSQQSSAKVLIVPRVTLKVPPMSARNRKPVTAKGGKRIKQQPLSVGKKGRLIPAKKTITARGKSLAKRPRNIRSPKNRQNVKIRRRKSIRHSDDDEEEDEESGTDSHEVFQLAPSKNLKLIVRKKRVPPQRQASISSATTTIKIRKRLPIRHKKEKVEVDDENSNEGDESDDEEDESGGSDDDEEEVDSDEEENSEEEEEEPVRESLRLKTKKKVTLSRRRKR